MKRERYISVGLVLFLALSYAVWYFLIKKEYVCHIDRTTGVRTTISVRWFELKEHLDHGDVKGSCEKLTYVPDDLFEKYLIHYGYDDILDNYVLTSNIETVTDLDIQVGDAGPPELWGSVEDFTGIEDFVALTDLNIAGGGFEELDLSKNTNLTSLNLGVGINSFCCNQLTSLDLTNNILLTSVSMQWAGLTNLDLSNNPLLTSIFIVNNKDLVSLNLKNGNNTLFNPTFGGNENLTCIQVDDFDYSTTNWSLPDPLSSFSEDCGY